VVEVIVGALMLFTFLALSLKFGVKDNEKGENDEE